jgi:hypothetical protein
MSCYLFILCMRKLIVCSKLSFFVLSFCFGLILIFIVSCGSMLGLGLSLGQILNKRVYVNVLREV